MKGNRASQQRIARDLGVSQALVSLALNGKRKNISAETYERIWSHAAKIGYRPKGMHVDSGALASRTVGFILRAGLRLYTQSNFFSHVQHGLHAGLLGHGYQSVFIGAEDSLSVQSLKEKLGRDPLFGLVILGQVDDSFVRAIRTVQRNVVAVSASYPGLCHSVLPNERQAMDQLVEHLSGLGHRQFAWLGGNKRLRQNLTRRTALAEALERHGLHLEEDFVADTEGGDRLDGRRAMETLLARFSRNRFPTALVCLNALMARGAINCLTQRGWRVPEQVSVVAMDATRVCIEEHPEITGASGDPEKMGSTAVELLLQSKGREQEALSDLILSSQLTVRETSAPVPAANLPPPLPR